MAVLDSTAEVAADSMVVEAATDKQVAYPQRKLK